MECQLECSSVEWLPAEQGPTWCVRLPPLREDLVRGGGWEPSVRQGTTSPS